ncbi:MAG: hypothetical protein QOD56_1958, partial [Gammaproteobacteria bacterium]|nr:hypothetical protein [Gammaproteobacteria bacterium]
MGLSTVMLGSGRGDGGVTAVTFRLAAREALSQ